MTKAPLDFETKDTYTVVITASDGSGGTDQITVTIEVKDRDEKPTLTAVARRPGDIGPEQCLGRRGQHGHGRNLLGRRGNPVPGGHRCKRL